MKCNKIIIGGCSFFNKPWEIENLSRKNIPTYIKDFLSENKGLSHREIHELYHQQVDDNKIIHYDNFKLSTQLTNKFNKEVISFTKNGKSNDSILDDIINYLVDNKKEKNNKIIIGLTAPSRIKRYYDPIKEYVDLKLMWYDRKSDKLHPEYILDDHYNDIRKYYEIYLKYFYNLQSHIESINKKLNVIKFISEINNHKMLIIDNLLFPFEDKNSTTYQNFVKNNKDYLFYFNENNFSWPKFIRTYDKDYNLSHPNSSDVSVLVDLIKKYG